MYLNCIYLTNKKNHLLTFIFSSFTHYIVFESVTLKQQACTIYMPTGLLASEL